MHNLQGQVACSDKRDVARIASSVYAVVMPDFGPVLCISVVFEKGIMKLTLV